MSFRSKGAREDSFASLAARVTSVQWTIHCGVIQNGANICMLGAKRMARNDVVPIERSERGFFCQLSRTSYIRSVDDPLWCNPEWRQYMYARCKANGEKRCRSDRKERERILLPA